MKFNDLGIYQYEDGRRYEGDYLNNVKHGRGKYWKYDTRDPDATGLICEGEFEQGMLNGPCKITW